MPKKSTRPRSREKQRTAAEQQQRRRAAALRAEVARERRTRELARQLVREQDRARNAQEALLHVLAFQLNYEVLAMSGAKAQRAAIERMREEITQLRARVAELEGQLGTATIDQAQTAPAGELRMTLDEPALAGAEA